MKKLYICNFCFCFFKGICKQIRLYRYKVFKCIFQQLFLSSEQGVPIDPIHCPNRPGKADIYKNALLTYLTKFCLLCLRWALKKT